MHNGLGVDAGFNSYISSSSIPLLFSAQELCESRGGRPGLPVPNKEAYDFCIRTATLQQQHLLLFSAQELCESRSSRPGLPVPDKPMVSVDVKRH